MNKIQASRLLTLAYFLKTEVPGRHFDMASFARLPEKADGMYCHKTDAKTLVEEFKCGTTACALGWCTTLFPRHFSFTVAAGDAYLIIDGNRTWDLFMIARFFGLEYCEAYWMFYEGTRTPKLEAEVIEQVVSEHGWTYAD